MTNKIEKSEGRSDAKKIGGTKVLPKKRTKEQTKEREQKRAHKGKKELNK